MPEEAVPGVLPDSPPVNGEPAAPPAEPQVTPEGTPQAPPVASAPSMKEETARRFEELLAERRQLQAEKQQLLDLAQRLGQPQAPQVPQQDPWVGLVDHADPATAQFWQTQKRLAEHVAQTTRQQVLQEVQPLIEAGRAELASISIRDFRRENPDIKQGSEEERLVVAYMNGQIDGVRHPLESAKRNALFDKLKAENQSFKLKSAASPQKASANASEPSSGIPNTSGLPGKPVDWRDRAREKARQGGSLLDVANAAMGNR